MRHVRHFLVPDEHHRAEIDGFEMEQDALARSRCARDRARVPKEFIRLERATHAGKRRFDGERHANLARPGLGAPGRVSDAGDLPVPVAVEARPVVAHHLRPRILAPAIRARHFLAPRGHQRGGPGRRHHARRRTGESEGQFRFHGLFSHLLVAPARQQSLGATLVA